MASLNPLSSPSSSRSPRCGLAGWHFPHWDRILFPVHKPTGFHPLRYLSDYFDTTEINASFYQPLKPELTRLWLRTVAHRPDFRFTAKLWRRFTHDRSLLPDDIERFHEGLRPLAESGKFGCLLMQFPWSFRFTAENRDLFIRLRRAFHAYPLVAEMRHASWSCPEALGTFVDYHVGFVNIDQPEMIKAMPPTRFLTSSIGYVRLHGRNSRDWWSDDNRPGERLQHNDYLYSPDQLAEWKQRIQHIRAFASDVYVVFNNDVRAQSAVNALQMRSMLAGGRAQAPEDLHRLYAPELRPWVERPRQQPLFDVPATAPRRAVA